jgi:hypothetical protein
MKSKTQTASKTGVQVRVPQMVVRCGVRAGDDLSTCQWNVDKWRQRYYDAYNKARQQGCI